jgi:hypothetical protein
MNLLQTAINNIRKPNQHGKPISRGATNLGFQTCQAIALDKRGCCQATHSGLQTEETTKMQSASVKHECMGATFT